MTSITDGERAIGNRTRVKVVKNKVAAPFTKAEFDIMYNEGISYHGDVIDLGVLAKVVQKSGAWFTYEGAKLGQGRENAKQFLKDNPKLCDEIALKVRTSNVDLLAARRPRAASGHAQARSLPPARGAAACGGSTVAASAHGTRPLSTKRAPCGASAW